MKWSTADGGGDEMVNSRLLCQIRLPKALERNTGHRSRMPGSFSVREYKGYTGRNPRTGESVEVAPKRLPYFKVGKELKESVDRGRVQSQG